MRIIHYEAEKRYVDARVQLCTVFLLYRKLLDHQTLGGFPKVKEGSSRGFDGK